MNLPCKKIDGDRKKVYNICTLKRKIYPRETLIYTIAVTLAVRSHLFSYRTQKLSSLAPKILDWRRSGKIGCCCIQNKHSSNDGCFIFVIVSNNLNIITHKNCRRNFYGEEKSLKRFKSYTYDLK